MTDPPPSDRPTRTRALVWALVVVATIATIAVVVVFAGDDEPTSAPVGTPSSTTHGGAGHGDDTGSSTTQQYGSHGMAPEVVTPARVGRLGPGPAVGETFTGSFGLNVCGRFLEPPAAATDAESGMSTDGTGRFQVTPPDADAAGHEADVDELMELIGVDLSTGRVTFPATTTPAQFQINNTSMAVAGATFGPDTRCGDVDTVVQVWVYSDDAVRTGEGVMAVEVDPEDTPIAQDGMALVVTVTPESSLPTLPPSALNR